MVITNGKEFKIINYHIIYLEKIKKIFTSPEYFKKTNSDYTFRLSFNRTQGKRKKPTKYKKGWNTF